MMVSLHRKTPISMPLTGCANCYKVVKLHGKNTGSEAGTAEWVAQIHYLLAVLPWVSHLTSLCLHSSSSDGGWQCMGCEHYRN